MKLEDAYLSLKTTKFLALSDYHLNKQQNLSLILAGV